MPNNTKPLTRGKAVIRARDAAAGSITIEADDTVISSPSGPIKRSSGQGYDVRLTTPFQLGNENSVRYRVTLGEATTLPESPGPSTYTTLAARNTLVYTYAGFE